MTTKDQERKALEKIRKIVEELGENSYIGTAFEGCFEIAEENIENDFACSMKQRLETSEKENAGLIKSIAEYQNKVKSLEMKAKNLHDAGGSGSMRANENMAMFMDEPDAIHDREIFVHNLGELLSQTRDGVVSCELINAEKVSEHVLVTYRGGGTRRIGTHMDSYAAIIRDVANQFQ